MAAPTIERLQAPTGGINTDASSEYLGSTQADALVNMLPVGAGKVAMRGQITAATSALTSDSADHTVLAPFGFWAFDDTALVHGYNSSGTQKVWMVEFGSGTPVAITDVTNTVAKKPTDHVHARYGSYVYGFDADTGALVKWDGSTTLTAQTNGPTFSRDLKVHMQRLFALGGGAPGAGSTDFHALYYSDANPDADLSVLNSWKDDVSGLVNNIVLDTAEETVGLASCGQFLAILCTHSIFLLTGSGSSNFAVRRLTSSWGCIDRDTIVESQDGFYFLSDRGFCFCDGSTVNVVSLGALTQELQRPGGYSARAFGHGYVAVAREGTDPSVAEDYRCWLYNTEARAWTEFATDLKTDARPCFVSRTLTYPVVWVGGAGLRAESITRVAQSTDVVDGGTDTDAASSPASASIPVTVRSRAARLGSPGRMATIGRLLLEYQVVADDAPAAALRVRLLSTDGTEILNTTLQSLSTGRRQRAVIDVNGQADSVQLEITDATTGTPAITTFEIYDAYLEFQPAQDRGTI